MASERDEEFRESARKRGLKPVEPPAPPALKKLKVANIFADLPAAEREEAFTDLLSHGRARIERIVSRGQATPPDAPLCQEADEWVILLAGSAAIRFEGGAETPLKPGDHLLIPGGTRHWVTHTDPDQATVWLAVHLG